MRGPFALLIFFLSYAAFAAAKTPSKPEDKSKKPRLLVMEIVPQGFDKNQTSAMTDAVVSALSTRNLFEVVSTRDVQTLLSAERQKQLLGVCQERPEECSNELASIGETRFVLAGQLSQVGNAVQLTLQMVDTQKGQPVARSTHIAKDIETIRKIIPYAAAEATGSPLPPPPSKVLPIILTVTGAAALVGAGAVALQAAARQQLLNDELCPGGVQPDGRCSGISLRERSFYIDQEKQIRTQSYVALGIALGGAACTLAGILIWPKTADGVPVSFQMTPVPGGAYGMLAFRF